MLSRRALRDVSLALCVLCGIACDGPTTPVAETNLYLSAPTFTRDSQHGADVRFTVANRSATTMHITARCGDQLTPEIEQRSGKEWRQYASGVCLTINEMSPVPLETGAQRNGAVVIAESGEFRLTLATDRGPMISSAFTIK